MKNTIVDDLFKAMDKAITISKPISDMTGEELKTFSDKLQELGLIKRCNMSEQVNSKQTLGMNIPNILYKRYYTNADTMKTIEEQYVLTLEQINGYIKEALKKHGVYKLDAIRFINKHIYDCYLCVSTCGVKAAMKVDDGIQAEKFIKDLDNFAELISGKIFNIDNMSEFDDINVKAFDWEIPEDCHK